MEQLRIKERNLGEETTGEEMRSRIKTEERTEKVRKIEE
jgi:hypothetical protein